MATYGNVGEFKESEESWTQYAERLEQYFATNEISDAKKQRAILLSVCGSKTYGLIRDLLQPKKPGDGELKEILKRWKTTFRRSQVLSSSNSNSIAGVASKGKMFQSSSQDSEGFQSIASLEQCSKTCYEIDSSVESAMIAFNDDCWPNGRSHSKWRWKSLQQLKWLLET